MLTRSCTTRGDATRTTNLFFESGFITHSFFGRQMSSELESARAMVANLESLGPVAHVGYYETETESPSWANFEPAVKDHVPGGFSLEIGCKTHFVPEAAAGPVSNSREEHPNRCWPTLRFHYGPRPGRCHQHATVPAFSHTGQVRLLCNSYNSINSDYCSMATIFSFRPDL